MLRCGGFVTAMMTWKGKLMKIADMKGGELAEYMAGDASALDGAQMHWLLLGCGYGDVTPGDVPDEVWDSLELRAITYGGLWAMTEETRNKLAAAMMDAVEQDKAFTPVLKMLINLTVCEFRCEHQHVMASMITRLREFIDNGEFDKKGWTDETYDNYLQNRPVWQRDQSSADLQRPQYFTGAV
jgi:hypothetical protein